MIVSSNATVNGTFQRGESVVGVGGSYKVSTVDSNDFLDDLQII